MVFKISVNKEECIGCGSCVSVCSESFEMKDGKAIAKKPQVEALDCEEQAKSICPVNAIKIEEK